MEIDIKQCCQLACVPYEKTYSHSLREDDSTYIVIRRTGKTFNVKSTCEYVGNDDLTHIVKVFTELQNDLDKIEKAYDLLFVLQEIEEECNPFCVQDGASFKCFEYVVKMDRRRDCDRKVFVVTATVENTKTKDKTTHELGSELNAEAAGIAIKQHIAMVKRLDL